MRTTNAQSYYRNFKSIITILFAIIAVCCSKPDKQPNESKDLNRFDATAIIQKSGSFNEAVRNPYYINRLSFVDIASNPFQAGLQAQGIINIEQDSEGYAKITVITDKAKEDGWQQSLIDGQQTWTYIFAKRNLKEVTGISKRQDGLAEVEFSWQWILTKTGTVYFKDKTPNIDINQVNKSTAIFKLYDDGWRVDEDLLRLSLQKK